MTVKRHPQLSVALIAVLSLTVFACFASAAIAPVPREATAIDAAATAAAHEQDRLLNATGGIKAVKESEDAKDLLYRLSWFFGWQGNRERAEAAQLEAKYEKLNRTTASLLQLVEQVSDVTLRTALLAQVEELKDRAQAVADMARGKRRSAGGFIDVIKSLLGLG